MSAHAPGAAGQRTSIEVADRRRHLGSECLLTQNTQANHADIVQHVTAVNRLFEDPMIQQFWNPATDAGRAALDAMITRQAQIIAYVDDFKLLMIATLAVIPLLIVFKRASGGGGEDHTLVVE
jgi:DHA2 family multidrug resistance protein